MDDATRNPLIRRAENLLAEYRYRISTRGRVPTDYPDATHYSTLNYRTIRRILQHLDLGALDVFVDVGCGKGRVLCLAALYPVKRVMGVDQNWDLCEDARDNAGQLRGRAARVQVMAGLADDFDYREATVLFLFDPFGADTCQRVLDRVRRDRAGQPLRLAYANPVHAAVFDKQPWLERTDEWHKDETGLEQSVVFYRDKW